MRRICLHGTTFGAVNVGTEIVAKPSWISDSFHTRCRVSSKVTTNARLTTTTRWEREGEKDEASLFVNQFQLYRCTRTPGISRTRPAKQKRHADE